MQYLNIKYVTYKFSHIGGLCCVKYRSWYLYSNLEWYEYQWSQFCRVVFHIKLVPQWWIFIRLRGGWKWTVERGVCVKYEWVSANKPLDCLSNSVPHQAPDLLCYILWREPTHAYQPACTRPIMLELPGITTVHKERAVGIRSTHSVIVCLIQSSPPSGPHLRV